MRQMMRLLPPFFIALGLDGLSKYLAELLLPLRQPAPVLGDFFRLTLGYNTGVAFGMFANGGSWPLVLTGAVIIGLIIWLTRAVSRGELPSAATWPIGVLIGGAVANFLDRLVDGRVTDFLDVGLGAARWPTFNLADSFIVSALLILFFMSYQTSHEDGPSTPAASPVLDPAPGSDRRAPSGVEYRPDMSDLPGEN